MAEFEREILRERVRAGLARAQECGVKLGRPLKLDAEVVFGLRRLSPLPKHLPDLTRKS